MVEMILKAREKEMKKVFTVQWVKAAFSAWFANVKNQLSTDAAGNLQNEIDNLQKWKIDGEILVSPSAS